MPRYKLVNGERIQFTAEEEAARDAEEKHGQMVLLLEHKIDLDKEEIDY